MMYVSSYRITNILVVDMTCNSVSLNHVGVLLFAHVSCFLPIR